MLFDFLQSLHCVLTDEASDYRKILDSWKNMDCHVAFMPAIHWHSGTYNAFDAKAGAEGRDMVWLVPAGQAEFFWLSSLKRNVRDFYEKNELELDHHVDFPGIEAEDFEECILLHSKDLQDDSELTILGANVLCIRLSLASGRETLVFLLLDHQDHCWKRVVEAYHISLTWLVESGRGMEDYYTRINLYQLMKNTPQPETLPALYFKGLFNKGEIPEGFRFLYAMFSRPDKDGYDPWRTFSAVYDTGWKTR